MHDFSVFFGDDPTVLVELQQASTTRRFQKGAIILAEGDNGDTVFYLLEGEARALRYSAAGAEVFIDTFSAGNLVGEMAVLGNGIRTADVYARTDVLAAVFPGKVFLKLMEKHGSIGLRVSRMLASRIQETTRRMFEQSTLSSKGRVYAELMRMAGPVADADTLLIDALPSISTIARKLGIARETVSRTVNELKDQKAVEKQGSGLLITAPHVLVSRLN